MTKDSTVKELINQASNTKYLVDEVNRAMYGYTMDEIVNPKGGGDVMKTAPDGGTTKELPESAFDYLIELWARSHNLEIVSVEKFANDPRKKVTA